MAVTGTVPGFLEKLGRIIRDPAIRYGLKFGLAGSVAVFIALYARLQEPTWALFTVFVLMTAQYVGAIAEKSIFRIIGTIVGAVIGYLLTASLQQDPLIYLPLIGIVVGASTAMFGQARYPYAFLLCGMTTVVVASNGLQNPDNSWLFMVWRIQEVSLGIIVTLVVQSVVWPRFARTEFLENMRHGFRDVSGCLSAILSATTPTEAAAAAARAGLFPERITTLRRLLEFGARESQHFRDRLPTYYELTECQSRIAAAIATLREPINPSSPYSGVLAGEIPEFHHAILAALDDLGDPASTRASRAACKNAVVSAMERIAAGLLTFRNTRAIQEIAAEEALRFSIRVLAFEEIQKFISRAHGFLDSLPDDPLQKSKEVKSQPFVWPPTFWIHTGIKSGVAIILALLIEDWLNPPGATMFALGTWVFTALNAASPGGQGDRRAFHFMVVSIASLLVLSLILLAGRPLLSSYAVMNTVIFTWLFLWGYLSYSEKGVTIPMQLAMLCIVGILGLNGQQPISFQQIVEFFFGMALALVLSSLIQRLLWPSLPQWEIRSRLVELAGISRAILRDGPDALPVNQRIRLALIPGEVAQRTRYIHPPAFQPGEGERLTKLLSCLYRIASHLSVTTRRLDPILSEKNNAGDLDALRLLEQQIDRVLASILTAFATNRPPAGGKSALVQAVDSFRQHMAELRLRMIATAVPPLTAIQALGFAERYCLAADEASESVDAMASIDMSSINGDHAL